MGEQSVPRLKIPRRLLIIDAVGTVLAGLGVAGLLTDLSRLFPFLADKQTAGIIAAIGFALVTFALGNIFRWQKMMRAAQQAAARQ
jgi:hypothetical protein